MSRDKGGSDYDEIWAQYMVTEYEKDAERAARGIKELMQIDLMTPKQIVTELDKTVIGQEKAKQLVAVAAFNRLLAMSNDKIGRDVEEYFFEKNNILLIGNTGCGKTHLIRALSKSVSLPVTIQDATTFTSNGYHGRSVAECLEGLFDDAERVVDENYDLNVLSTSQRRKLIRKVTEFGIVYIDEADKLRASGGPGKDVNGRSVQESFLKLVEGTTVRLKDGPVDTSNMLFIFGGAFAGLDKIILNRTAKKTIGFVQDTQTKKDTATIMDQAVSKDFTDFGMIPELVGRLSTVAALTELDKDMIYRIFSEPKRSIMSQVVNEFKSYGVEVSFSDEAIEYIAAEAMKLKLGARGLKSICQGMLRPLFFRLPSSPHITKVVITKEMLENLDNQEQWHE